MTIENFIHNSGFTRLDVELLLSEVLSQRREYLYAHGSQKLKAWEIKKFKHLLELRKKGKPMAYILGKKEFYSLEFQIKPGVFIPRPDTETLVSAVIKQYAAKTPLHLVDFGCGSGCIGLSLLKHFKKGQLTAIDSNPLATKLTSLNASSLQLEKNLQVLDLDISECTNLKAEVKKEVDLIVANPPYIAFEDPEIEEEVRASEPHSALFSKEEGLYHIRSWFRQASELLKVGGNYFFEIGRGQDITFLQDELSNMREKARFYDLSKNIRVVQFQKCHG